MNKQFHIFFLLFTSIFISISASGYSQEYWLKSESPNTNLTLYKVISVDSLKYYVAADSGNVFYSSNAGVNWIRQQTGILNDIRDINFVDANTGYAIAWEYGILDPNFYGSIILKTTNGGLNWNTSFKKDSALFYYKIYFFNNQIGYLVGDPGISRTINGGNNWEWDYIDTTGSGHGYPIRNISLYNSQIGIACGGFMDLAGVMWRTTTGGDVWIPQGVAPEPLIAIHLFDDHNFVAVGGDFEYGASLVKTSNAGVNWDYLPLNEFGIGSGISFRSLMEGWIALGIGQKFLYTNDGGIGWRTIATPNGEAILDVNFSNKRHGVAVGQHGAILRYNSNLVSVQSTNSSLPSSVELKQNYPNPFNPETIISFTLDKPKMVSLKIYDMLGKEIKNLVEGTLAPGEHKVKFDAADIPAGVYFYTLKTDNQISQTKKMILVK